MVTEIKTWLAKFGKRYQLQIPTDAVGVFETALRCLSGEMLNRATPNIPWVWFYSCLPSVEGEEAPVMIPTKSLVGLAEVFQEHLESGDPVRRAYLFGRGGRLRY